MEHEEYTAENYPSFGKKYANEKAIISLTSWKARINTVSKTLYSLLKQCPGFHIVLVLSEEEFPKMMDELPENLKLFVDNELIEVLWVYKNYKSFKKVLFTMDKYRDVPVISADDDCIYTGNYAELLYKTWLKNKNSIITNDSPKEKQLKWIRGTNTLFPTGIFYKFNKLPDLYFFKKYKFVDEDITFGIIAKFLRISIIDLNKKPFYIFHDTISPQSLNCVWNFKDRYNKISNLVIEYIKTLYN
jgi:hypothetical protein